jgi:hypothetical protein
MDLLKVMLLNRFHGGGSAHHGVSARDAHTGKVSGPVEESAQ